MSTLGHVHVLDVSRDATFRDVNASGLHVAARCGQGASPTVIIDNLYTTDSVTGGLGRQQGLDRRMHLLRPRVSEYIEAAVRVTFTMPRTFTAMPMAPGILAYHTQHSAGFEQ